MALKVTETNNTLDSNGIFLGIEGKWFWLPIIFVLIGVGIGFFRTGDYRGVLFGGFCGLPAIYIARFLSQKHNGWLKLFVRLFVRKVTLEPVINLHARRTYSRQFNRFWRP